MALRFIDPALTTTVDVDGVSFTVGYWPHREVARISALVAGVRKIADPDHPESRSLVMEANRRAVEYGVRGWSTWDGGPVSDNEMTEEDIGGRKYPRVSARVLDSMCTTGLIFDIGAAVFRWNDFGTEEKKRSPEPSGSGTPNLATNAPSAFQDSGRTG